MRRPIGLEERQRAMVERAVGRLPKERREEFLRDVAARLGETPSLLAVEIAVGAALERRTASATGP